ncbi:hypothetical protein PS718_00807 [Pseudomonas fluorescens]|uniref:Uncharacterized protein n=1 Tax=Pseudomonas fluorescens TaxID=294 RepID=A0A5E7ACS5_PSEFL|nr:hypothetical protein [Pseudomonas fluorescens]VVN76988.1 hypothetical protein PS718_00807 [Pseudomonas fluorescens]
MKKTTWGLGLWLALSMPAAQAASQEIRALFQPDSTQPNKNTFVNKTPNSGYCATFPEQCAATNMFSIRVPMRFDSTRPLRYGDSIPVKVPSLWRQITVTNQDTQETETVEVRIMGVGSNYVLSRPAFEIVGVTDPRQGHEFLWSTKSWVYAPPPCQYSGVGNYSTDGKSYRFFWKAPKEVDCAKVSNYYIPSMYFDTLDFAYELRTPNPLGMSSGLYTGAIAYSVGPGGDFSLGPLFTADDGLLNLDFVLDVQHTLKVDLPPGGNKVSLEPEGGWAPWINSGRKPTRIFRDQLFYISASSRFKVMLLCSSNGGNDCSMFSPKGDTAQFQVFITLPPGITGPGGPVTRHPLNYNNWAGPFQPDLYVDRKAGSLNFDMTPFAINFLLRPGKNDTLSGNVTIIWDSDV